MSAENMQAQVIAGMIVAAIIDDERPDAGGFDLSAGMFGPSLSGAVRQLAKEQIDLQRQLDEVTRERDQYKAACVRADALRNQERGL